MTKHDAERKVKIIDYIAATLRRGAYPPSVREIARAVGPRLHVRRPPPPPILEREGYLERGAAQSRALRLTPTAALQLGLVGRARPAVGGQRRRTSCRSSARSPPAARSRRTRTSTRPWPCRSCWRRAGTRTCCGSAATRWWTPTSRTATSSSSGRRDGPQRRHRRRPGRGERRHPQALLQGEGPGPPPARQRRVPADVLRRRPDPGQADRGHPPGRLTARPQRSSTTGSTVGPAISWTDPDRAPGRSVDRTAGRGR